MTCWCWWWWWWGFWRSCRTRAVSYAGLERQTFITGQSKPPCKPSNKQTKRKKLKKKQQTNKNQICGVEFWIVNVNRGLCGGDIQPALTGSSLLGTLGWARHPHTCILAHLHTCSLANLQTCILANLHSCKLILYASAYLHTCTCTLANFHTCILSFLHTSSHALACMN